MLNKSRKRADRRHEVSRRKCWAQRELARMLDCHQDQRRRLKFLGMLAETPKLCSCWMCGNPRRHLGELTLQEVRARLADAESG